MSKSRLDSQLHRRHTNAARRAARRGALLGVAAWLGGVGAALAQPLPMPEAGIVDPNGEPTATVTQQITQGPRVSLAQATAIAQGRYPGRVARAATFMQGDRVIHEIRIIGQDNVVRTVLVDGQTGAIL